MDARATPSSLRAIVNKIALLMWNAPDTVLLQDAVAAAARSCCTQ